MCEFSTVKSVQRRGLVLETPEKVGYFILPVKKSQAPLWQKYSLNCPLNTYSNPVLIVDILGTICRRQISHPTLNSWRPGSIILHLFPFNSDRTQTTTFIIFSSTTVSRWQRQGREAPGATQRTKSFLLRAPSTVLAHRGRGFPLYSHAKAPNSAKRDSKT